MYTLSNLFLVFFFFHDLMYPRFPCVFFCAVVDDQGDIIVVPTEAPSDEVHFTRQAQFLVGERSGIV